MTEREGQVVFTLNSKLFLPEDAPVRLTNAQLEELDYRKLYEAYSSRGRKSVTDPRVLFKLLVYGYQCGIYTTRKLEEACRYRIDFQRLLWDEAVPDHSTISRFRTGRCAEAVEDLFYQYVPHGISCREAASQRPAGSGITRFSPHEKCGRHGRKSAPIKPFKTALFENGKKTYRGDADSRPHPPFFLQGLIPPTYLVSGIPMTLAIPNDFCIMGTEQTAWGVRDGGQP
jgi:transposase